MEIRCVHCQKLLRIPESAAGKRVKCPICSNFFDVPQNVPSKQEKKSVDQQEVQQILQLLASGKQDIEKSIQERGEAMEMVDGFFQFFLERSQTSNIPEEQKQNQEIAHKLFQLQQKFPLLAGLRNVLNRCEKIFQKMAN